MLLICCIGLVWYGWYESTPVLKPYSLTKEEVSGMNGMKLDYFEFQGADGLPVKACVVTRKKDGDLSPRQSRIRDLIKLRDSAANPDGDAGIILIATTWDNGIEHSLPYAEAFSAAGYACVLWGPQGVDAAREYCTYGLRESEDVPLLIDALQQRYGRIDSVAAFGKGFGAAMMMFAAPRDERIRSLVSIDNFCILRTAILNALKEERGKLLAYPEFWLIDTAIDWRGGYSSFDVVPVDAARNISVPVLLVCEDKYFFASMDDTITIYESLKLPEDKKAIYAPLEEGEAFGTTRREHVMVHELKNGGTREDRFDLNIYDGEDDLLVRMIEWLPLHTLAPLPKVLIREMPPQNIAQSS